MIRVLLLGAGSSRDLLLRPDDRVDDELDITTLDINLAHNPDILWDLNRIPWPPFQNFHTGVYDEIHAYEILEHLGTQGDAQSFFDHFYECWRLLKPDGSMLGTVPAWDSEWAWGDPSHTRVITPGTFTFLDQTRYDKVGESPMSDFRGMWKGDFELQQLMQSGERMGFFLKARKPVRTA